MPPCSRSKHLPVVGLNKPGLRSRLGPVFEGICFASVSVLFLTKAGVSRSVLKPLFPGRVLPPTKRVPGRVVELNHFHHSMIKPGSQDCLLLNIGRNKLQLDKL